MKMNKQTLTYSAIGVLGFLGIALYFYFKGKKSGTVEQVPLPSQFKTEDGETVVLSSDDSERVRKITLDLYEDLDGMSFGYRDSDLYKEFSALEDRLFVAVYNDFNNYYKDELDNETLRDWIKDDDFSFYKDLYKIIMERFDTWNLP